MGPRTADDADEGIGPATGSAECAAVSLGNGELLVYDTEREEAWIQSDAAVEPAP